jgi:hypothetical protein
VAYEGVRRRQRGGVVLGLLDRRLEFVVDLVDRVLVGLRRGQGPQLGELILEVRDDHVAREVLHLIGAGGRTLGELVLELLRKLLGVVKGGAA